MIERRLLQIVVAVACLVPLGVGGAGALLGTAALGATTGADLDSHFRYVSGIFFGVGLGFASCVPRIEAMGARFRLLAAFVVIGGVARALGLLDSVPSIGHRLAIGMELGVVPLLVLWQRGVAARSGGAPPGDR